MTEIKKITIHRALGELKLTNSKIEKAISQLTVIKAYKKSNDNINGIPLEKYKESHIQASYDKVTGLIKYRNLLKNAIVLSNAQTVVEIGDEKMTVAEAIERKESIHFDESFLITLKKQLLNEQKVMTKENLDLEQRADDYIKNVFGPKDKLSPEELKKNLESFRELNEYTILDPLNVFDKTEKLSEKIDTFKVEVDAVLSESNATTFIEIELP